MVDKRDIKEKIKKIYDVLPKLDDQQCGYKSCGEFAKAVAEGKAPCYGCVSGGPEVTAKVCEIMGAKVPQEAVAQFGPRPQSYQPGLSGGRGFGRAVGRGLGVGRGRGPGRGRGRGGGMGRGFGRGRRGR
jgi:Na+-translocating ferredoxin:NAD+ oxidoreductase RNF subunit RnfB